MQTAPIQLQTPRPTMASCVGEIARPLPVAVSPTTPITEALALMDAQRIGSIVIMDSSRVPVGILTMRDVLQRIALPQVDQTLPIAAIMTTNPVCIPLDTTIHKAALRMAKENLRHLLITAPNGMLTGVISKNDIYNLLCSACVTARTASVMREKAIIEG